MKECPIHQDTNTIRRLTLGSPSWGSDEAFARQFVT